MNNYLKLGWLDVILAVLLYFIGANITASFYYFIAKVLHINFFLVNPLSTITNYIVIFIIYYFINLKPRKEKFRVSYSFKNFQLFPVALLLFLGQFLFSEFVVGLIPTEGPFFGKLYNYMDQALMGNLQKHPWITFLMVCIIAPIGEELFFRGFILKGMLNNKVNPAKAIIISALIFGGIHIFPWQVAGGIFGGLILGLTFYKTGSLLTCTLLHFLNNFIGLFLYLKYGSFDIADILTKQNELFIFFTGVVFIVIFGFLYLKLTKNNQWNSY